MKMGHEHRAPLSPTAVALLNGLPRMAGADLLFPAPRGGALSDMTLSAVVRRMKVAALPHGFRSTFRDWASERTNYPRDVAEMALAHAIRGLDGQVVFVTRELGIDSGSMIEAEGFHALRLPPPGPESQAVQQPDDVVGPP